VLLHYYARCLDLSSHEDLHELSTAKHMTDKSGRTSFKIEQAGSYSFRTNVEVDRAGKDGDDTYQQVRHHATLIMQLPLKN